MNIKNTWKIEWGGLIYIPLELQMEETIVLCLLYLLNFLLKNYLNIHERKKSREYSTINPTYPSPVSMNIKILCMFSFSLFLFMSLLLYFKAIPRVYTVLPKRQYLNTEWLRIFQNQWKRPSTQIQKFQPFPSGINKKKSTSGYFLQKPQNAKTKTKSEKQPGDCITCSRPCS